MSEKPSIKSTDLCARTHKSILAERVKAQIGVQEAKKYGYEILSRFVDTLSDDEARAVNMALVFNS